MNGQTILDTEDASYDAYLWNVENCKEQWLAFEGNLMEISQ